MKTIRTLISGLLLVLALTLAAPPARAIEGLKLTLHCPDVVLSWPSTEGETYLVQFRETLGTNTPWQTLTNDLPAATGTNVTTFTHSNRVECPSETFGRTSDENKLKFQPDYPLIIPGNGSRAPVPLGLYPPEIDLTGYVILWPDGSTNEWSAKLTEGWREMRQAQRNGLEPQGIEDGSEPDCGFYRVVRNGLHLSGVQNGMALAGTVDFLYELGATNIGIPAIRLYSGGVALPQVTSEVNSFGQRVLRWNTAFAANGAYDIYAQCDFDEETIYSSTNTVFVTNMVHFEDFMTDFGDQIWVYAELAVPEAEVLIDIYSGAEEYIGTFYDYTTNGIVSFAWDLIDPNGMLLTNETFHSVFNVNIPGHGPVLFNSGGSTNPPPWMTNAAHIKWNKQYGWSADDFVVAWGITPAFGLPGKYDTMMQQGVVDILANPAADFPYTLSPGNSFNGNTYRLTSAESTNLLNYLAEPQYRNFFYYGHGNSSRIGDYNDIKGWIVAIDEDDIRAALGNHVGEGDRHPYRFVFLYTCNSAAGSLCDAFGIINGSYPRAAFLNIKTKARAFVGFKSIYNIPGNTTETTACAAMLAQFFAEWRDGLTLNGVVQRAMQNPTWPLPPSTVIYGAFNLYRFYPY